MIPLSAITYVIRQLRNIYDSLFSCPSHSIIQFEFAHFLVLKYRLLLKMGKLKIIQVLTYIKGNSWKYLAKFLFFLYIMYIERRDAFGLK